MALHDVIGGLLQAHELRQQHAHLLLLLVSEQPQLVVQALCRLHHPHLQFLQSLCLLRMLFSALMVEGFGSLGSKQYLFLHFIEFKHKFASPQARINSSINH